MKSFKNKEELYRHLEKLLIEVLDEVSDEVMKKLRERIMQDVYGINATNPSFKHNSWYVRSDGNQPTGEFFYAWLFDDIRKGVQGFFRTLRYRPETMHFDADEWIHGSPHGGDARENLADILNMAFRGYSGGTTAEKLPWKKGEPYWENFKDEIFSSDFVEKVFSNAFRKRGLYGTIRPTFSGGKK